jgi:hypothetical protein
VGPRPGLDTVAIITPAGNRTPDPLPPPSLYTESAVQPLQIQQSFSNFHGLGD